MNKKKDFIEYQEISTIFSEYLESNIKKLDNSLVFYNLEMLEERLQRLNSVFPPNTLHAAAIKACPLINIIKKVFLKYFNIGVEVASRGELETAIKSEIPKERIVFDSPAKTVEELELALLKYNVYLNIDNFQELDRVKEIVERNKIEDKVNIGLRINPQVGKGKIADTSVADIYSKFGVPIEEREQIISYFEKNKWLKGVHLHVGSQGCDINLLTKGIHRVYELAEEINKITDNNIKNIDIGGGLPIPYNLAEDYPTLEEYVEKIKELCPNIFQKYRIITEFGRWIFGPCGWVISKVEYTKYIRDMGIAIIHVGADIFIRKCLQPHYWDYRILILDKNGKIKTGKEKTYNIAGPLCFGGDIIAYKIKAPLIEPGDYIAILDTGAYTLSIWSRYNSRLSPSVIGYYLNSKDKFILLRNSETIENIVNFWT